MYLHVRVYVHTAGAVLSSLPLPHPLQEVVIEKDTNEKLGISIRGGAKGSKGNPLVPEDEGIFISKVGAHFM